MASRIKLDLYQDKAGKYRWRIRAQNGNVILASSQGYTTLASAGKNLARAQIMLAGLDVTRFMRSAPVGYFNYQATIPSENDTQLSKV